MTKPQNISTSEFLERIRGLNSKFLIETLNPFMQKKYNSPGELTFSSRNIAKNLVLPEGYYWDINKMDGEIITNKKNVGNSSYCVIPCRFIKR